MLSNIDACNMDPVRYGALPFRAFGTYNSNSFTYTLLSDVHLQNYFGNFSHLPFLLGLPYPGWGLTVPGI